ncbi:MAG: ParB/RepB/Spo0J family partition protein, partial [bacterium]|nr:ParB/RepB/Spo0J family partition protein [bacterium]
MAENVALNLIDDNPYQTRQTYDRASLDELAADIVARGLLQPPVGRRVDGRVQLAFGHRRKRAFVLLAQEHPDYRHLPLEIKQLSDEDMALCAWSENARRRDVSPVEEASAIRRMMDTFGWTQRCTAERLGLSRSAVSNKLRLLRLPDKAREQIGRGALSERQALALLPVLELPEPAQERIRESWCKNRVQTIFDDPQDYSSATIRRTVNDVLHHATADLAEAVFAPDEPVAEGREGVRAARCGECEFRVRRGKGVLCGDVQCHDVKE